ncbi:MAG TPA: ABC transporter permease [Gemmatimonadaceae bacterium]
MDASTLLREALQSIRGNRVRTLLTMLGIVIGVGAVIVLVALGNGARQQIEASINSLGTNVIMIIPGSTSRGGANQGLGSLNSLTVQDAEKIKREAMLVSALSPVVVTHSQVIGGESNWSTRVYGVSVDYFAIRDWDTSAGEPFADADVRSSRKVALLGATVARSLFADRDPVGAQIRIGHVPFTVVGVLRPKGQNAGGADEDDIVLIPYTTAQSRLSGDVSIGHILANTPSPSRFPAAQEEIAGILREAHKLNVAGTEDDFLLRDQTQIVRAVTSTTRTMSALLAAIASISLLVGGIGIMNIMLVSVTERTREIGIRRATGARARDVLGQFLVESVAMSVMGGLVGLVGGYVGAALLGRVTGWRVATPLSAVLIAVCFSAAVGVFFGLYPARKAAALDPIEALRYE